MPRAFAPQLATLVAHTPSGEDWLHEIKFDGYRLLCFLDDGAITLRTRRGNDWTHRYPEVVAALQKLPSRRLLLDAELIAIDARGHSDFQALQNAMRVPRGRRLRLQVFDAMFADGFDLTAVGLLARKEFVQRLLSKSPRAGLIQFSAHHVGDGDRLFDRACAMGLEGVISKRIDAPYLPGRSRLWVKSKCVLRQEFVIGGYTPPQGSREAFGSLLLGTFDQRGGLRYCGRVGAGFDDRTLRDLKKRFHPLKVRQPPFISALPRAETRHATWLRPKLVAEVRFAAWTGEGRLRQPAFMGLREDKSAREIVRETPLA